MFLAVRAFARLVECSLLLWRSSNIGKDGRGVTKVVSMFAKASSRIVTSCLCGLYSPMSAALKMLKKLKLLACKFTVFKPRYLHLNAYWKYLQHKQAQARKLLSASVHEADCTGNKFDKEWATHSKQAWFGTTSTENTASLVPELPLFTLF